MNAMSSILTHNDSWSNMLKKDVVLWRSCSVRNGKVVPNEVQFEPTEKGSFIARIVMCSPGIWEPEVCSNRIDKDHYTKGIALFVSEIPPPNWTHLVIAGVSKPFGLPGKPTNGGCVFAKVAIPLEKEDYEYFRSRLYEAFTENLNASLGDAIELSNGIWPDGIQDGERRLVVQKAWKNDSFYCYDVIDCLAGERGESEVA
jgi:hypothetical protein